MWIAIVDESATRAAVIREGLAAFDDCELFVVTERRGLVAQIDRQTALSKIQKHLVLGQDRTVWPDC